MSIRIALSEDNSRLRQEMVSRLQKQEELQFCFAAVNGADCLWQLDKLDKKRLPQIILMDIEMPEMDGIEATRKIQQIYPEVQVLMLTIFDDDQKLMEAIQAGAVGYILKGEKFSNIMEAIRFAQEGGSWMSPAMARKALQLLRQPEKSAPASKATELLSPREAEVLELLVKGMPLPEVAEKLFISYGTVRTHVRKIYEKLQVSNKVEATQLALKKKWFS